MRIRFICLIFYFKFVSVRWPKYIGINKEFHWNSTIVCVEKRQSFPVDISIGKNRLASFPPISLYRLRQKKVDFGLLSSLLD